MSTPRSPFVPAFPRPTPPRKASAQRRVQEVIEDDDEWEIYISNFVEDCESRGEDSGDAWEKALQLSEEREELLKTKAENPAGQLFTIPSSPDKGPPRARQVASNIEKKVDTPKFDSSTSSAGADQPEPVVIWNPNSAMPASPDRDPAAESGTDDAISRKELQERRRREEEDYDRVVEAQKDAEQATSRAREAEEKVRKLEKEVADLQASQHSLTEQLSEAQVKNQNAAKESEAQRTTKHDLEEKWHLLEEETASLYKELSAARQELHKTQDEVDEKEVALNELAKDLYEAENRVKEEEEKNEAGNAAQERLDNINREFEQIFEELGNNLTIEEYMKHVRDVQAGNIARPRRDSQASNSSFHNARPGVKQRQVSIQDELLRAGEQNDDDHSPDPQPIKTDPKPRLLPSDPISPHAQAPNPTGSPTPRARRLKTSHLKQRQSTFDPEEEPFGEKYTVKPATSSSATQTDDVLPPSTTTTTTTTVIHQHEYTVWKVYQPPWWIFVVVFVVYLGYEWAMRHQNEWIWANDTSRQGRVGNWGREPMWPLLKDFERKFGVGRSMLG